MADQSMQHPKPDDTDLLIRSISSLLYYLWPFTTKTTQVDATHSLAFLNDIALLFVSGSRNDCAAIATFVRQNNVHVEAIQEPPHEHDQSQSKVFRNVKSSVLQRDSEEATAEALLEELLRDPLRFRFTKGLHAITPKLQARVLQDLLTKMYGEHATNTLEDAKGTLVRYIFCFGVRKMRRRLNTKINESTLPYIRLLTSPKISREDFITNRTNVKPQLPKKLENADELWLKKALEKRYKDMDVQFVEKGEKLIHLCLNSDQEWKLWTMFGEYLDGLQALTGYLEDFIDRKMKLKSLEDDTCQNLPFEIHIKMKRP
ncbi:hypothetical protein FS837_001029 [Tulasnella sp. UAMH 9824]|nr:hypothetical protein FS837_001029 [Tulasnella sp. UAMH 9824]